MTSSESLTTTESANAAAVTGQRGARVQTKITVDDPKQMVSLLGPRDEFLKLLETSLPSDILARGNEITLSGTPADNALSERVFAELLELIDKGEPLAREAIIRIVGMLKQGTQERPADVLSLNILSRRGRTIRPKTLGQKRYVDAIDAHTIVFGIGPAGTGKTYLAMAKAVQALQAKQINRIILTRPAVEAGERLGFLPGTLFEKIDPYLRPLYDALHDMLDPDSIPRLMQAGTIEVAPLAYMRGRAQPVDTPVLTPDGFRPIGELRVGDLVIGSSGEPTPVLGVYPQGEKEIYRLVAQDGSSTRCCGEHLWTARAAGGSGGWRVVETRQMIAGLARGERYELPMLAAPARMPERAVPMDPYALGRLLGDGSLTGSSSRTLVVVGGAAVRETTPAAQRYAGGPVPEEYRRNAPRVRLAVLQGILDAGGQVVRDGRIRYSPVSAEQRDDVVELVRSLGGTAHRYGILVLDIRLPASVAPFRLERKRAIHAAAGRGERPERFVAAIEPAGRAECVCIQVAAEDSLYVTEDYLLTHNTLNDAFIILDEAQNTTPEQMKMFLTRLGFGSKIVVTGDVTQVDLPSGTRSGLRVVQEILADVSDINFSRLTSADVVRHRLVSDIVDAYAKWDDAANAQHKGPRSLPDGAASNRASRRR